MRDELLQYYDRELTYLRQKGQEFAKSHPGIAKQLALEPTRCDDPHVERLLEAFAFLTARIHLKLDDEFPEITEALLEMVYPHFVRPMPSASIVEFEVDPKQGRLTERMVIPRKKILYSRTKPNVQCRFRTCYDTTLWPLTVKSVDWKPPEMVKPVLPATDAAFALRIELGSPSDLPLSRIGVDRLRFYLAGDRTLSHALYELLCSRATRVLLRDGGTKAKGICRTLPATAIQPVGFEDEEAIVPYPARSFQGYRLLQEYFSLPEKFLFVDFDFTGIKDIWAGFGSTAEIVVLISKVRSEQWRRKFESGLPASTFRLNCTPIVNLFPYPMDPIPLDQRRVEYPVIPDRRRPDAYEVFSVDGVSHLNPETQESASLKPFYSHRSDGRQADQESFWLTHRRSGLQKPKLSGDREDKEQKSSPGDWRNRPAELYLSFVDASMRPRHPDLDSVTLEVLCSNGNAAAHVEVGDEAGDFELEENAPIRRIIGLHKPTPPARTPRGRTAQWHLVSHLSLNQLSLVDDGHRALQTLLRLYDVGDSDVAENVIDGIVSVNSKAHITHLVSKEGIVFARGKLISIVFDEEKFTGAGLYLFISVLEKFLARYASMNSFTQLVALTEREEKIGKWPPRAGRRILV